MIWAFSIGDIPEPKKLFWRQAFALLQASRHLFTDRVVTPERNIQSETWQMPLITVCKSWEKGIRRILRWHQHPINILHNHIHLRRWRTVFIHHNSAVPRCRRSWDDLPMTKIVQQRERGGLWSCPRGYTCMVVHSIWGPSHWIRMKFRPDPIA